jgi:exosortase A
MNTATLRAWAVPSAWRVPLLACLATVALVMVLFADTLVAMVTIWNRSETYAHAFVVPPITVWLIWRMRAQIAPLRPVPSLWVAGLVALFALLWRLGDLVQVAALQQFMLVGMLVAVVPATLGWQVARALMFPLGFLFFAVPFGEFLTPTLVQYTADFTVGAVRLSGVPVFREGNQFVIPSGRWSVVEACSGIRYLMASLMVGTLFAYLNYRGLRRRWAFVGVSLVVPIVANWLRAYMIVMIGHLSDNRLATGVDHIVYGWVFFGIVITAMFVIGARWTDTDGAPEAPAATPSIGAPPAASWATLVVAVVLLVGVMAGVQWATRPIADRTDVALAAQKLIWPARLGSDGPSPSDTEPGLLTPSFAGAHESSQRAFDGPAGRIWVYVARYRFQDEQRKLVSSVNGVTQTTDHAWNLVGNAVTPVAAQTGPIKVRALEVVGGDSDKPTPPLRVRARQFYWIDGHAVAGDVEAKLRQAWQALAGRGSAAVVVVVYAVDEPTGAADARLDAFFKADFTGLSAWLATLVAPLR